MTDDLKERLSVYGKPGTRGSDHPQSIVCRDALAHITDLEARLAVAEAGEDALEEIAYDEDFADPKCGCLPCRARFALAAYEARRKG